LAVSVLAILATRAEAMTIADARATIDALRRSADTKLAAQEPILQAFEVWAKQFYALVDRGAEAEARSLFGSIYPLMKDLYEHNKNKTESMVQATIRVDGDLEATQNAPDFRDAEVARLRTMYHLNWVSYLGATLLPPGQRKTLLDFAVEGFGEFVVGPDAQIAREALFGRSQAYKGLEEWDEALADLRRLIELGSSSPHYSQARLSAVQALLGARRTDEAAREAQALIADAAAGALPAALATEGRLLRAQALFVSLKQGGGGNRQASDREALSLLRAVEREGGAWRRKAQAVAAWGLEGLPEANVAAGSGFAALAVAQSLMLTGKHTEALAQLEPAIQNPATPAEEKTAARFYAGLAAFQIDRYAPAARYLRDFLQSAPGSPDAPEASYLLFKSLEQVARVTPTPETDQAFRQALRTFVERFPSHSAHAEGRFRLAELLRDDGDVLGAVREFRAVKGNRALEIYAEFNAAQAMFTRLRQPPPATPPEQIERERGETIDALGRLIERLGKAKAEPGGQVPADELGAKASIMAAILATEGSAPRYTKALELTRDFAKRFPGRPELARQAFAIEILALQKEGDPARAEQAVNGYLDSFGTDPRARQRLLKRLGREFYSQSEADGAAGRKELADASSRISIAIYGRLLAEVPDTEETASARRGIHAMLGELYAKNGNDGEASTHYTEVLRIDPRSVEALKGLAEIAGRTREYDKATRYWDALAGLMDPKDPGWIDARYAAAVSAGAAGNRRAGCRFVNDTRSLSPYPLVGDDRARFDKLERQLCGG
jgi:tetratricopeptide (TPR) repeat protein